MLRNLLLTGLLSMLPLQGLFAYEPDARDVQLLSKIEQDSIQYFVRMSDKVTGLTRDSSQAGSPASIAATGFALAAVAIGQSRGWIPKEQAYAQIKKTLRTLLSKADQKKGFFYHFLDPRSGKRVWGSEVSSIDTTLLVAGALLAGQYYPGTEIEAMAKKVYARIDWQWMMNNSSLVCMGWKPESGFLPYYWNSYNEHLLLQALAIGSPTHPIPAEAWNAWTRNEDVYRDKDIVYSYTGCLFTYQYAQAYIDFRELDDRGINYFDNSVNASIANWEYSSENRDQYKSYGGNLWGLSASLGPAGYKAYGAKPGQGLHDGTIAPHSALSSINFTPERSIAAAHLFFNQYQDRLYDHFGFKDAFNLDKNWWAEEYLGIDQGITVLMLENYLNHGAVWNKFMQLLPVQFWIKRCNLLKVKSADLEIQPMSFMSSSDTSDSRAAPPSRQ
ncbi:MAG: glucoamylase family protein [Candidatus Omnitrophica bacterium]|nr:glucoamylase family protein [Candidatus Omnitrophota bacterium]MDD5670195.1 glucoamylase family protein [Candidatus Omnitrophota bacterium]